MAISYTIVCDGQLLRVKASGKDDDLSDVMNYGMAILTAALEHGVTKILCDETELEYAIGILDTYESAKFIAENVPEVSKTAIVCKVSQMADAVFWETVAINRGLQVKAFMDLAAAREWLDQ